MSVQCITTDQPAFAAFDWQLWTTNKICDTHRSSLTILYKSQHICSNIFPAAALCCEVIAMKLICCLLALALLGCRAHAQNYGQGSQNPEIPRQPPAPQRPKPGPTRYPPSPPQQPEKPQQPQNPLAPFHTCEVADNYKIQCGVPTISAPECDAINCCFDGHMCYYGKSGKQFCFIDTLHY